MTMTTSDATRDQTPAPSWVYRLESATRTYQQKGRPVHAVAGVDLEIATGDFVTIQGPTGGGKSTLLQLLGALDRPTSGHVHLGEVDMATASNSRLETLRAQDIGFVFQGFNLIPTLTASENVDMALEPLRLSRAERESQSQKRSNMSASPSELSTGRWNCPVVNSSAWPSRERSSSDHGSSWRMSPPGTWTSPCGTTSCSCSNASTPRDSP